VGTAAKLGNAHLAFWLLAIALFYLPQAAAVIYLNRLMPLEGGIYQWATAGLGRFAGFLGHPRFRTPVNSIAIVGALTLAFTLAGQIGVGVQEAFQLIENVAGILYGFTYLGLFAIPLVAAKRLGERPPWWLRLASLSGLAVSLLYCVLSILPIIEVASWQLFAAKIVITLLVIQVAGIGLYAWGRRGGR